MPCWLKCTRILRRDGHTDMRHLALALSQAFQPMAAELLKKTALPLPKIFATASCRSNNTGPSAVHVVSVWPNSSPREAIVMHMIHPPNAWDFINCRVFLCPAYADPAALEAGFADPISDRTMWGGLVFTNDFVNPNAFPKDIRYTLRPRSDVYISSYNSSFPLYWNTENMFPEYQTPGPRGKFDHLGGYPGKMRWCYMKWIWWGDTI